MTDINNKDWADLSNMAAQAVRNHGIDADDINSDTIHDKVFDDVFGEAVNAEQFVDYEAKDIADALHEAIGDTYWKLVDEANGLTDERDHDETMPGSEALEDISHKYED
jgi:hypothetical protein